MAKKKDLAQELFNNVSKKDRRRIEKQLKKHVKQLEKDKRRRKIIGG